jgi:phosphate-selective porin OprO/OprP
MASRRSIMRAALAFGALAFADSATQPALADDTAAQIRELKALMLEQQKRIQQLEAAVAKSNHESQEVRKEVRDAKKRAAQAEKAMAANPQRESNIVNARRLQGAPEPAKTPNGARSAPPPVIVSFANGLLVESLDRKWSFKVGGRILMDGGGITQPLNGFNNYATFRQVRLEVEGKAAGIYFYKLQYDFAGTQQTIVNNGNHVLAGMRDAYWGIQSPLFSVPGATDPGYIMVGSQWEPFSLEQINSSKYRDLIERAAPVDTFSPSRHLGLAIGAYGENWTAKGGLFTTSFEDANPFPARDISAALGIPRYYFPNAGNLGSYASAPNWFQATGGAQYFDLTGRLSYAPVHDEHRLLHFGVGGRYHQPNDSTGFSNDRVLQLGNRVRSEEAVLGQALLGTPDLSCGTITAPFGSKQFNDLFNSSSFAGKCVRNVQTFNAEIAASYGALGVQAEYFGSMYNRDQGNIVQATLNNLAWSADGKTITGVPLNPWARRAYFDGYYIQGTYWLTGEERASAYLMRDKNSPASFGQLKIRNPLSAGGYGAWGLAARFSSVDLNNGPFQGQTLYNLLALYTNVTNNPGARAYVANAGIIGGRYQATTLGLNWYPDPGFSLQANWTHVFLASAPLNGIIGQSYVSGATPDLFELRARVYW